MHFFTVVAQLLSKSHLKAIAVELIEILKNCDDDLYQTYVMALDVINTIIYVPPEPKKKRIPPKYQLEIPFTSTGCPVFHFFIFFFIFFR